MLYRPRRAWLCAALAALVILGGAVTVRAGSEEDAKVAIQAACDARSAAMARKDPDAVLAFQTATYARADAAGRPRPPSAAAARQDLVAFFSENGNVLEDTAVDRVALSDDGQSATVSARDRLYVFPKSGPGVRTDSALRDFWVYQDDAWRLSRRRVLSARRTKVPGPPAAPAEGAAGAKAGEADDPVFGPKAPQQVVRYTFGEFFPGAKPQMSYRNKGGKRASRDVSPGQPPEAYAKAFYDICLEVGLKAKLQDRTVWVTDKNGVGLAGFSPVTMTMVIVRH